MNNAEETWKMEQEKYDEMSKEDVSNSEQEKHKEISVEETPDNEQEKYKQICKKLRIPIVTSYLRDMTTDKLIIPHRGIGDRGLRAIAQSLRFNSTIKQVVFYGV